MPPPKPQIQAKPTVANLSQSISIDKRWYLISPKIGSIVQFRQNLAPESQNFQKRFFQKKTKARISHNPPGTCVSYDTKSGGSSSSWRSENRFKKGFELLVGLRLSLAHTLSQHIHIAGPRIFTHEKRERRRRGDTRKQPEYNTFKLSRSSLAACLSYDFEWRAHFKLTCSLVKPSFCVLQVISADKRWKRVTVSGS